jgi:PAS domain S-box-containing protein
MQYMMAVEKFQDEISIIKTLLYEHPEGLNIKTISKMLGIHRNSVAKYLDRLQSQGSVTVKHYSSSKIYSLSNKLQAAAVLKLSKNYVILINHGLIVVDINDPLCEFLKISKKDIVGKTVEQLPFVVQSHPELPALIKEGLKEKESKNPVVVVSGDHLFPSMLTISPVFFENGDPGVSLMIDVPIGSEQNGCIDTGFIPSGPGMDEIEYVCQFEPDGTITFVNEIYCHTLQKSKADLLGHEWRPVIPESEFTKIKSSLASIDKNHPVSTQEFRTITPKGEHRWQRWKFRGIFDLYGSLKKYQGVGLDITELKQLKEKLKKTQQDREELVRVQTKEMQDLNKQLYDEISHREKAEFQLQFTQFAMDNASYMIIWINVEGRFVYMNTKAREVLVYSTLQLPSKNIFDILSSDTRFSWNETWEITKRDRQLTIETAFTTKDGREIPVEMVLNYLEFKEKQYCCCFARDITERERILTELKIANLYNRSLIEASLDPLVTINPDGKISDVNAATVRVTGHSREGLIGTDFSKYFTEPEKARAGYEKVFRDGLVTDYELGIRHKDGHVTPVMYNATVYRDESGNVIGVFAAARDITERKKAEEEQLRLAAIVEHSEDAIIGKSLDGIILSWNAGAERIYGYSATEAIGQHISMLVPLHQIDNMGYILGKIRSGEPVLHYETVRRNKGGKDLHVSLTVSPIKDVKGNLIGVSTIARDITEQKKAEEAIRRANAYNRSLIEASLDPLVTIDPDGKISDVNAATVRVTGFLREELIGTDFSKYFTEPEKARAGYEKVFRDGLVTDYELGIRHKDGHVTPVMYNATVYRDESGNVIGVFAAARDVTN